jgi:hypothetical protein
MFRALLVHYHVTRNCVKQLFIQLCALGNFYTNVCAPWWWVNKPRNMNELIIYNTAVILIKLCACVGLDCNKWTVVQGMENESSHLTPELNPSAQRCLTRILAGDFASWTVHFVNICVKNQQIHQLFIQFINYVW